MDCKNTSSLFTVGKSIGHGTFGDVVKARLVSDPTTVVAIKQLRRTCDMEDADRSREVMFFKAVPEHAKLITLYDMYRDARTGNVCFALEYMDFNSSQFIESVRKSKKLSSSSQVSVMMRDTSQGVEHIHKYGFVHRDIKPENVSVHQTRQGLVVKLADFGSSRPMGVDHPWTSYVATRWYRAPEQSSQVRYHDAGVDIWAIAVIACESCNLRPVFPGKTTFEMVQMQLETSGLPSPTATGGESLVLLPRLSNFYDQYAMPKSAFSGSKAGYEWFRRESHEASLPLIVAGSQWDAASRPSATRMLAMVNKSMQSVQINRVNTARQSHSQHISSN